ncbi:MAG TPA: divalent-cation tolerance protein CutA [Nitrospirae bacterium]|nr:divalent-cation tolerance protein CutA [Nitrospirota bacterium]
MEAIVVYVTSPNEEEAVKIAKTLLEERLCACVNIIKSMRSLYHWQGNIEDDSEVLMIIKTQKGLFKKLSEKIKAIHPYTVAEIISLPIIDGSDAYLKWLKESTV